MAIPWTPMLSCDITALFDPVLTKRLDKRLVGFCLSWDRRIWKAEEQANHTLGSFSPIFPQGENVMGRMAVAPQADGRLVLVIRGNNNHLLWTVEQAIGGAWTPLATLPDVTPGNPCIAKNRNNQLVVFYKGYDGAIWALKQAAPNGAWTPPVSLGGYLASDPAVGWNQDGRLEVFAIGMESHLWHNAETPAGPFGSWSPMGGQHIGTPAVSANENGTLVVFTRGTDAQLWMIYQTAPNNGWSQFVALPDFKVVGNPVVARDAALRNMVFAMTSQGLAHRTQTTPNLPGYDAWDKVPGMQYCGLPAVLRSSGNELTLVVQNQVNLLQTCHQNIPVLQTI